MTLGAVSGSDSSSPPSFCSCCGAKMGTYFSDDAMVSENQINRLISESFLTVKGAALFLPRRNSPTPNSIPRSSQRRNKHTGDLQKHLQTMFTVLRPEDTIRLAVRLESTIPQVTRYMVVVSTNGRQDTEESIVLGMDFVSADSCCTVGLVLPLWSDTMIHLDGDGGFSVSTANRVHVFKPVSVQAMWSALQSLHKACEVARCHNHYPGSLFLTWVSYYQSRISSNQFCVNEWNALQDVESHRAKSPVLFTDLPTEREHMERLIKTRLREIMMQKDLESVTCKEIRAELEMQMVCDLGEFKKFIGNEMIVILGQMDSPTEIFEHVYLGSEWNASNLDELQNSGVRYILNVTREIDNFFPGVFEYHNIRVYDEEATNLLEYWNETYKFITKAKKAGAKCLVHCKMGVSRSASTVIAYAMKEYGWDLDTAFDYVKEKRNVTQPNPSFMKQLEEYEGILLASKQRHNKLWRSHSDSDLSDRPESMSKRSSESLARSNSHNNNTSSPSLDHLLGVAVLQALAAEPEAPATSLTSDLHVDPGGVCVSPGDEEVEADCEDDPFLHPLPRPQAATLVPDEPLDNSASVAVTVPVALPHPPPSLHILPPTPELQRARGGPLTQAVPEHKPLELSPVFSEQSSSEEVSPLTLGSADSDMVDRSLSDLLRDKHSPLSPVNLNDLLLDPSLAPGDDNNNPSELPTGTTLDNRSDGDGSSSHSKDSINFFSAREKFLGLAQDGRSQQAQQRGPQSSEEESEAEEEGKEEGNKAAEAEDNVDKDGPNQTAQPLNDNGISVRHIVTEIEAICHPAPCPPTPASPSFLTISPSSSSPQLIRAEHQTQPETSEVQRGSLSPPSVPPRDWPVGSVRRATEQLEQKLREEMEMAACQRSPLHSPSAEHPPLRLSLCPLSTKHPPLRFLQNSAEQKTTQGVITAVSAQCKDRQEHSGSQTELHRPHSGIDSLPVSHINHISGATPTDNSHILTPAVASTSHLEEQSPNTSAQSQRQSQSECQTGYRARSNQMTLDGATVQESDTDDSPKSSSKSSRGGCGPDCEAQSKLARGSQELERIQQTLKELQAFLHEGFGPDTADSQDQELGQPQGLRDVMDAEPCKESSSGLEVGEGREGKGFYLPAGWHRAVELEARMRQAGLTPPSLMKRSASLAKLDSLELSANDLSDLDLRPQTRTSSSQSQDCFLSTPSHPDDTWKKQKVFAGNTRDEKTGLSHRDRGRNKPSSSPAPCVSSAAPRQSSRDDIGEREEPDGGGGALAPAARQQGRGHSSRRPRRTSAEKKQRAVTVLYNTM